MKLSRLFLIKIINKEMSLSRYILTIFLLGFVNLVSATGPSYIHSEIRPISINNKGEVLCRTRFLQNPMGAHTYMPVTYGLCVLSKNRIVSLATYDYNPADYEYDDELCVEKQNYLDSIFYNNSIELADFTEAIRNQTKEQAFISCNVDTYKVDKDYTLSDFKKWKKIDLANRPQKALNGAVSINDLDEEPIVYVLYDFGNIVLIKNVCDDDGSIGIRFNYQNMFGGNDIGFDISDITGVVFR